MSDTQRTGEARIEPAGGAQAPRLAVGGIIRRYYALSLGYSFGGGFLFAVYPLYLRSRGLDQLEVNGALAIYFIVTFLTDVPTGAFADALGRRRSFMIGCGLRTLAFLTYFFAYTYGLILFAEAVDGVGTTFCNGAIDAWGVDALDEAGFDQIKDRLFSRIVQMCSAGLMISALIGAYVANVNIAWPWLLGALGFLGSGVLGALLMDDRNNRASVRKIEDMPATIARRIAEGLQVGFKHRAVRLLSIATAIFFGAWAPYWLQWPQYFNSSYNLGVWVVGWLYCLLQRVSRLLGAEAVVRFAVDKEQRRLRLFRLVLAVGVMLFAAGAAGSRTSLVLALLFVMNACMGAIQPLSQSWLNEQITAGSRATLLSFNSTFRNAGRFGWAACKRGGRRRLRNCDRMADVGRYHAGCLAMLLDVAGTGKNRDGGRLGRRRLGRSH